MFTNGLQRYFRTAFDDQFIMNMSDDLAIDQCPHCVAQDIEVKKETRRSARKAKEKAVAEEKEITKKAGKAIKKAAGIPNIIIQSPMGGYITPEDIAKKVPKNTADVYVKVDENKLYYVLKNGKTGDVDIWD